MATIYGTAAADTIFGPLWEANFIFGEAGNDILYGGNYQDPTTPADMQGVGADYIRGGLGNDRIYGLGGNDLLRGDEGDDYLDGGDGNDLLRGGSGTDYFVGGDGEDRISLFHLDATQGAYVDLRKQFVYNDGYGNAEKLVSIEGVGQGTQFSDTFIGTDARNVILGDWQDKIEALGGDDYVQVGGAPGYADGGKGNDTLSFGVYTLGPDGDGDGLADLIYATKGVHADLAANMIFDDGFGRSGKIVNFENLTGTIFNDTLAGDSGANVLIGGDGHDYLEGREGNDTLDGGAGNDALIAGEGDDHLLGGAGKDKLYAGKGNDKLVGGEGGDYLFGEDGKDAFIYDNAIDSDATGAMDYIGDFEHGADWIDISGLSDEVAGGGPLVFTGVFSGTAGEVTLDHVGGSVFELSVDLDGDASADFAVTINAVVAPTFADIIV
ncbi:calcium-binding protein [Parasphingopyxis marina]|uniref:Calcium-binding protein n=1 Tax=Parasphingopyxis marina TaxID=2761622 RepID=A0A842I1X2_9SPHN|nr:calcium-binding protein [Parasphingopyxis marina]MBC2778230.1 calcium-binding protein [Parasphingopyxis marina]